MTIGQASVSRPHHLLKLPELGKEAWQLVIDLGRILRDYNRSQ